MEIINRDKILISPFTIYTLRPTAFSYLYVVQSHFYFSLLYSFYEVVDISCHCWTRTTFILDFIRKFFLRNKYPSDNESNSERTGGRSWRLNGETERIEIWRRRDQGVNPHEQDVVLGKNDGGKVLGMKFITRGEVGNPES